MTILAIPTRQLDRLAIGLSGLCVVHCLATTILLAMLASAGGILGAPWIHETGLALAMLLGTVALGRGVLRHGLMLPGAIGGLGLGVMAGALSLPHGREAIGTILGVGLLALAHELNRRAVV